jgi:hypothetical protein
MPGVVGSDAEPAPPEVKDVVDYLDMWTFIEEAYANFGPEQKKKIEVEAEPFGRVVRFPGFDGNNEVKLLSIARLLVNEMGRFTRFKGRDLNSHAPLRESYARMYKIFEPMRTNLGLTALSPDKVAELLRARRHLD